MINRIAFYHVNKCAGTSLLNFFMSHCRPSRTFRSEMHHGEIAAKFPATALPGLTAADFIHDPRGVMDWKSVFGNTRNILWLRDPIDRLLSQIDMIARWSDQEAGEPESSNWKLRETAKSGPLEFLTCPSINAHRNRFNGITAFLQLGNRSCTALWDTLHLAGSTALQDQALKIAQANLYAMDFIGFVDDFDRDFQEMARFLGFSDDVVPPTLNVAPVRSKRDSLDEETQILLRHVTHVDQQIYEAAQSLSRERRNLEGYRAHLETSQARFIQYHLGPRSSIFSDASDPCFIKNWHFPELNESSIHRWTGAGSSSEIVLHVEKNQDLRLRLIICDVVSPAHLNDLSIYLDGQPLMYRVVPLPFGQVCLEADIEMSKLNIIDRLMWISLNSVPGAKSNDKSDDRNIGIAVRSVEVGPQSEYVGSDISLISQIFD